MQVITSKIINTHTYLEWLKMIVKSQSDHGPLIKKNIICGIHCHARSNLVKACWLPQDNVLRPIVFTICI